jgi:hypothetical protein
MNCAFVIVAKRKRFVVVVCSENVVAGIYQELMQPLCRLVPVYNQSSPMHGAISNNEWQVL